MGKFERPWTDEVRWFAEVTISGRHSVSQVSKIARPGAPSVSGHCGLSKFDHNFVPRVNIARGGPAFRVQVQSIAEASRSRRSVTGDLQL